MKIAFIIILSLVVLFSCEESDSTPPSITILSPQEDAIVSEIVQVTCIATDNVKVKKVELWIDGASTGITDKSEPYTLLWNTSQYEDGASYIITVRSYDTSDNQSDSDPVTITIDQSDAYPTPINIASIRYDTENMTVDWQRSQVDDFDRYDLYSGADIASLGLLTSIYEQDSTRYILEEFSPTVNNFFRITVFDTVGLSSTGEPESNILRLGPNPVDVTSVSYTSSQMIVNWEKYRSNHGDDFVSYELLYSETEDGVITTLGEISEIEVTSFVLTEFDPMHENWFWVKVTGFWGLTSMGVGQTNAIQMAPEAVFNALPNVGTTATVFSFDASESVDQEEETNQLEVRWDWENDGIWDTEYTIVKTANHQFDTSGSFLTHLEVRDSWGLVGSVHNPILVVEEFSDIDGNVYRAVPIGTQTWMIDNLKVKHYRDGTEIVDMIGGDEWTNIDTGGYYNYDNSEDNFETYGNLYNWFAVVDSSGLAPEGWHIPSDNEWRTLLDFLGGSGVAGGKMKEIGLAYWRSPNAEATNESGFSALPGGMLYHQYGSSIHMNSAGYFWTATGLGEATARYWYLHYASANADNGFKYKLDGLSVRCVKD